MKEKTQQKCYIAGAPGRGCGGYCFGFNGMEDDGDWTGGGGTYTTEFRMLDSRIGRWMSVDPIKHFAQSPYNSFNNNPVYLTDARGADGKKGKDGSITATIYLVPDEGVTISEAYRAAAEVNIKEAWGAQTYKGNNVDVSGVNVIIVDDMSQVPSQRDGSFNVIEVKQGTANSRSYINSDGYTGVFHTTDVDDSGNAVDNVFAHEFGHMLGLEDRYHVVQGNESSGEVYQGFRNVNMSSKHVKDKGHNPQDNLMAGNGVSLTGKQMGFVFGKNTDGMTTTFEDAFQQYSFFVGSTSLDKFDGTTTLGVKGCKVHGDGSGITPYLLGNIEFAPKGHIQGLIEDSYKTAPTVVGYLFGGTHNAKQASKGNQKKGRNGRTDHGINEKRRESHVKMKKPYEGG